MALQHLRSGTADKRPTPGAMSDGQLAINTNATSTGLFFKDSAGALVKVGPVHVGTTAPNATPATGGEAGNSVGEQWLDTSGGGYSLKIWDGSAWRSEAGEFVNASGDTMTGALVMDNQQQVRFRETTANGTNYIALQAPASVASDKTITLPDVTGTVVTTGDTGSITSTMIADSTIVDGDISASAEIAVSKLADGAARQLLQTDAAGTGVEWTSNVDVPGTLDVTSTATFDSIASHPLGTAGAPTITFTGDTNTGIYSPGADQVAISTNGTGRLFIDGSGNVAVGTSTANRSLVLYNNSVAALALQNSTTGTAGGDGFQIQLVSADGYVFNYENAPIIFGTNSTERLRITSDGKLGLGSSSPDGNFTIGGLTNTGGQSVDAINVNRTDGLRLFGVKWDVSSNEVRFSGNTKNYVFRNGSGEAETVRITSGGLVGIGNTGPGSYNAGFNQLVVGSSGDQGVTIVSGTSNSGTIAFADGTSGADAYRGYVQYQHGSTNALVFATDGSERFRCDSSGRVLVGTSSVITNSYGSNAGRFQVAKDDYLPIGFFTFSNSGGENGYCPYVELHRARGTQASPSAVASNDDLGLIHFYGHDGSTFLRAASIKAVVDGTSGTNDMPGRLVFSTTSDSASSPTERVRINAAGAFKASLAGTYESSASAYHELRTNASGDWIAYFTQTTASNPNGVLIKYTGAAPNSTGNTFLYCEDNAAVRATIRSNGGIANYSANDVNLSDINAKKDIALATGTWDCLKEWEIVNFRYKEQPDDADLNLGVIAQQVAESCPEVITIFQEATDDHPEKLGVKEQQMMWMAIKALQEAQLRIETLEAEVAALKAS